MKRDPEYFLVEGSQIEALRRVLITVQQRIDDVFEGDCLPVRVNRSILPDEPEARNCRLKLEELF
jgi:hypothetical protein